MIIETWEHLVGRVTGPMAFRFILQPAMAAFLAIRAGLRDARAGRPPYLLTVCSDPAARQSLLREGWKDICRLFILACILDIVYQGIVLHWFHPLETVIIAALLAIIPYALIRGPTTRIARRFRPRS